MLNVNPPETRGVALALQSVTDDLGKGLGPVVVAGVQLVQCSCWGEGSISKTCKQKAHGTHANSVGSCCPKAGMHYAHMCHA
jgi:hypothetical protein